MLVGHWLRGASTRRLGRSESVQQYENTYTHTHTHDEVQVRFAGATVLLYIFRALTSLQREIYRDVRFFFREIYNSFLF